MNVEMNFRNISLGVFGGVILLVVLIALLWGGCALGKEYAIWSERKRGEAEYAHAEANRKITILEAEAKKQAARALGDAEVIRAEGVALANKIIGDSLQNNEGYLRYLWIQGLQTNEMQVVYVPTEAGLPLLEAGRCMKRDSK
jgi:uncharacterized iron-regulated membrane protein